MEIPPTLLLSTPLFPYLLPLPPQPYPVPPPLRRPVRISRRRDLSQEAGDLSDEEIELEDFLNEVRSTGYMTLVPLGKTLTQHEEKEDQAESTDTESSGGEDGGEDHEDGENESAGGDLDADMQDLDGEVEDEDNADVDDIGDYDDDTES